MHNSSKIIDKKQKIKETPLSRGINFALCKDANKSLPKTKELR
jgi:hypothetical protein